jgi:hypothetical protein
MKKIYRYWIFSILSFAFLGAASIRPLHAEELPTYTIEMADGRLTPSRLVVPANVRFKIILRNTGRTAVEFESLPLRKEKVLSPGAESFIVIKSLSPGEYAFFDDFHQSTAQGTIVAQ